MLSLPAQEFDARRLTQAAANSLSLVRFDTNSYSVPVKYGHRKITVVATVDEVRLIFENQLIARHARHWRREQFVFDPIHYLALLERKPGGFDHARPLGERRSAERRLKAAKFPNHKTLDEFDFSAQPAINKPLVLELIRGDYLDRRENILLVGNSGTGKTHLATALGIAACSQGKRVRFFRITELITTSRVR